MKTKIVVAAGLVLGVAAGHSGMAAHATGGRPTDAAFVHEAETHIGAPYVFGGDGPDVFDCSGLVQYSLSQVGVRAPRTSEDQWDWVHRISLRALRPGDLVFEQWPDDAQTPPGHVVIYAGHGQVVEAPQPGQTVHVRPWSPHETWIVGYGQVPGLVT